MRLQSKTLLHLHVKSMWCSEFFLSIFYQVFFIICWFESRKHCCLFWLHNARRIALFVQPKARGVNKWPQTTNSQMIQQTFEVYEPPDPGFAQLWLQIVQNAPDWDHPGGISRLWALERFAPSKSRQSLDRVRLLSLHSLQSQKSALWSKLSITEQNSWIAFLFFQRRHKSCTKATERRIFWSLKKLLKLLLLLSHWGSTRTKSLHDGLNSNDFNPFFFLIRF